MSHHISPQVQKLHIQFQTYGRNAREWMRKCVLMLPELERERVWEQKGFSSLSEYAGRLSGMSREMVYEGLRVLHAVEHMPDIMQIVEERGIGIVRPVLTLLTNENQTFWASKMKVMSKQTLALYRQEWERHHGVAPSQIGESLDIIFRPGSENIIDSSQQEAITMFDPLHQDTIPSSEPSIELSPVPKRIVAMEMSQTTLDRLEKLKGDSEWDTLMNELMDMRETMLTQEQPEEKVTESRHIPAAIEKHVIERSRGICEFGTCPKHYAILHHVQRFALEHIHDPTRIIALCKPHERMVHLGLIQDEHIRPTQWKLTEEPDKHDPKYLIDQMVQKYRQPG